LKKQGSSGSSLGAGLSLTSEDIQQQLNLQQQKHFQELTQQRELFEKQIASSKEETSYYQKKCERIDQDLQDQRKSS
jgi:hypothetical protein